MKEKKAESLIARERAPKASTEDMFHGNPGTRLGGGGGGRVPEKPETEFIRKQRFWVSKESSTLGWYRKLYISFPKILDFV